MYFSVSHNNLVQRCVKSPHPFAAEIYPARSDSIRFHSLQVKFLSVFFYFLCCLLLVLDPLIIFASSSFFFSFFLYLFLLIFTSSFLIHFCSSYHFHILLLRLPFSYLSFFFSSSKYVGHCAEHLDLQMPLYIFKFLKQFFFAPSRIN